MLVARSYGYDPSRQPRRNKAEDRKSRRNEVKGFGWRPESFLKSNALQSTESTSEPSHGIVTKSNDKARVPSAQVDQFPRGSASASSNPVAVPKRRSRSPRRRPAITSPTSPRSNRHDANSMPPSVAALLAMTQIPRKTAFRPPRQSSSFPRRMSAAELRQEWAAMEIAEPSSSLGASPTMDLLLSPPEELDEDEAFDVLDEEPGSFHYARSVSSDSVPSLSADNASIASYLSPPTPRDHLRKHSSSARKHRVVSLPSAIERTEEHPLMHFDMSDGDAEDAETESIISESPSHSSKVSQSSSISQPRPSSTFRSNLSASLAAIRSAARSLSNFAAPSILPEDHLSSGFFGSERPFRPELRPRHIDGTPNAQLRRYLNPHAFQLHDFHLHNIYIDHTDLEGLAITAPTGSEAAAALKPNAVIQLQDYASIREARAAANSAVFTEAGRGHTSEFQHRREPRENAEFLRICVLEMQMLRAGKIQGPIGIKPGRRAFWLSPRETSTSQHQQQRNLSETSPRSVPRRWVGELCE